MVDVLKDVNTAIGGTSDAKTASEAIDAVADSVEDNVVVPKGKITITENGTDIDVSTYATADVAVEGSGGLASAVFPYSANVTYNVSGQGQGMFAVFAEFTAFTSPVCAIYDEAENVYNLLHDIALTNGEHSLVLLGNDGLWMEYNPTNWTVTVSGDAEIQHEDDAYWIDITGDCTINAVFTG